MVHNKASGFDLVSAETSRATIKAIDNQFRRDRNINKVPSVIFDMSRTSGKFKAVADMTPWAAKRMFAMLIQSSNYNYVYDRTRNLISVTRKPGTTSSKSFKPWDRVGTG